jgi:hypothetical protein
MLRSETARPPTLTTVYWLIEKREAGRTEMLTIGLDEDREMLPVFSYEEEARLFLCLRGLGRQGDRGQGSPPLALRSPRERRMDRA